MGLNLVDNTNYGFVGEKTGTFTPNFTEHSGSNITVKQIGNIVYISGTLYIDGTWSDVSANHLGDITGVDVPSSLTTISVITSTGSTKNIGFIMLTDGNDKTYIGLNVEGTDMLMYIDGFYMV